MKNNKGFTLIELLGVVVILAMLALLVYPAITSQLQKAKSKLSAATVSLIETGTRSYLNDNKNEYPKINGTTYCIGFDELAKEGYIQASIIDANTNEELDLTQVVIAKYNGNAYTFEIKDACN